MIFKQLNANNFRVFNGLHEINLQPRKDGLIAKPIVLFGGLNGAGKTSILTAIRLILLGRQALGKAVTKKDYLQYLIEQINKTAAKTSEDTQACIELVFTHTHQGQHNTYTVSRKWSLNAEEKIELKVNGQLEEAMTSEQIQSLLNEIVPPGIGDLFFFDGEKIAELAEDDTGNYLKEAVQKLLGIDVINRLVDDLDIYIKQISKDKADKNTLKLISELEAEKNTFIQEANQERECEDQAKRKLAELESKIQHIEHKIQERGGAWAKTKTEEKSRANELLKDKSNMESKILHELDGSFPLSLAPNAVRSLIDSLEKEKEAKELNAFSNKVGELKSDLTKQLADQLKLDKSNLSQALDSYFDNFVSNFSASEVVLDISDSDYYQIKQSVCDAQEAADNVKQATAQLDELISELDSLSINIQRAPDENELASLYEELRVLEQEKYQVTTIYTGHLLKAKSCVAKALEHARKLEKLYTNQKSEASLTKAIQRVDSTTNALTEFSKELTELRVKQLEELFVKSYRKLARKGDLKLSAKIDPTTFDVTLVDNEGIAINRKSMSAGEKQIFAFAILEALGKLSGKVLPVVVDTPLGRLDSKHRDKLIKHYFPEASEQVILLSTDTEVDEDFYQAMEDSISHAFEINFDQTNKSSTLSEGYFWKPLIKEAV